MAFTTGEQQQRKRHLKALIHIVLATLILPPTTSVCLYNVAELSRGRICKDNFQVQMKPKENPLSWSFYVFVANHTTLAPLNPADWFVMFSLPLECSDCYWNVVLHSTLGMKRISVYKVTKSD